MADRGANVLEVDPVPDALGGFVRRVALARTRHTLVRLGEVAAWTAALDGWPAPPPAAGIVAAPAALPLARALAGLRGPRLLCVRGRPADPALIAAFAPDIVLHDADQGVAEWPAEPLAIGAVPLNASVADAAARDVLAELLAADLARQATHRARSSLTLQADELVLWDGFGALATDGIDSHTALSPDWPARLLLPAIGRGAMTIACCWRGTSAAQVRAHVDGRTLPGRADADRLVFEVPASPFADDLLLTLQASGDPAPILARVELRA